jgi:hypothetical protein
MIFHGSRKEKSTAITGQVSAGHYLIGADGAGNIRQNISAKAAS